MDCKGLPLLRILFISQHSFEKYNILLTIIGYSLDHIKKPNLESSLGVDNIWYFFVKSCTLYLCFVVDNHGFTSPLCLGDCLQRILNVSMYYYFCMSQKVHFKELTYTKIPQ